MAKVAGTKRKTRSETRRERSRNFWEMLLPDDVVPKIAEFCSVTGMQYMASLDRRTRSILSRPEMVQRMLHGRPDLLRLLNDNDSGDFLVEMTTYEDLGFIEAVSQTRVIKSNNNRIHRIDGSLYIADCSRLDVQEARQVLLRFSNAKLLAKGHCEYEYIVDPAFEEDTIELWSVACALSILDDICCNCPIECEHLVDRIVPEGYGRRVAYILMDPDGWCEIFYEYKGVCLPKIPDYYDGVNPSTTDQTSRDERDNFFDQNFDLTDYV